MNRKAAGILAILVCFLGGAIAGASAHKLWLKYKFQHQDRPIPYQLGDREQDMILRRLEKDLNLSKDQVTELHKITESSRKAFKEFFDTNRPIMEQLVEDFETQIKGILTEDQMAHFQELKKRQREMMRMPMPNDPRNDPSRMKRINEEKVKIVDHFFDDFDKDHDGYISREETPSFLEDKFDFIDEDHDKKLSKQEVNKTVERRIGRDMFDLDREMHFMQGGPPDPREHMGPPPPPQDTE